MVTIARFEDMLAWEKARMLTRDVYRALQNCRDAGLRDQIQRAAVSVMSNIAEGFESGTKLEFLNYLYIAKASAGEVRSQLYAACDIGYLNVETFKRLKGLAEECSRLIASFIMKLKQGGRAGLQYKREVKKDPWVDDLIRNQGLVRTAHGLKRRDLVNPDEIIED
ncbi:MAG: four helix bundle protein [Patescibacteria group bacterium]